MMCSSGGQREDDSPPVAVVHGTEYLLKDALCLLFFQLGPRLQQQFADHLIAVKHKLDSLGANCVPACHILACMSFSHSQALW